MTRRTGRFPLTHGDITMQRSIPVAAALGLALVLTSCSGDSGSDASTDTGSTESTGSLTVWVDETRINDIQLVADSFTQETGVEIELVQKANGDIRTEFIQQVPTGEGPDVVIGANDWVGELVSNGVVAPVELGDEVAAAFPEQALNAFVYDDVMYGVPYAIENIALVRNNALATETPETFDALVEQARGLGTEYPVLIQQGDAGDPYHLYPLQSSFGAEVFVQDENGNYTEELAMGGEPGTNFAAYLATLGANGVIDTTIDGEIAKQAFLDGQSPYMITGPWNTDAFVEAGMDISVLPIPSAGGMPSRPFIGVQGVFISARTENAVLANEFVVNHFSKEATQDALYEAGGRAPALTASAEKIDDPIVAGFSEAGLAGQPQPAIPAMATVWAFWGTAQAQILTGQAADPAAAWDGLVSNIQAAIDNS